MEPTISKYWLYKIYLWAHERAFWIWRCHGHTYRFAGCCAKNLPCYAIAPNNNFWLLLCVSVSGINNGHGEKLFGSSWFRFVEIWHRIVFYGKIPKKRKTFNQSVTNVCADAKQKIRKNTCTHTLTTRNCNVLPHWFNEVLLPWPTVSRRNYRIFRASLVTCPPQSSLSDIWLSALSTASSINSRLFVCLCWFVRSLRGRKVLRARCLH